MARGRGRGGGRGRGRGGGRGAAQGSNQGRKQESSLSKASRGNGNQELPINAESQRSESADSKAKELQADNDEDTGKRFRRRQVTSNWHRYEEPLPSLDDEFSEEVEAERRREETYRLEAFEDLMKRKHGQAGFRFQSEQLSEEEATSSATSINCRALASSLQGIALHHRLDLNTSLLEPSTVAEFEKVAESRRAAIQVHPLNVTTEQPSITREQRAVQRPGSGLHITPPPGFTHQQGVLPEQVRGCQTASLDDLLSTDLKPQRNPVEVTRAAPQLHSSNRTQHSGDKSTRDDELDALLAISTRCSSTANTQSKSPPFVTQQPTACSFPEKHKQVHRTSKQNSPHAFQAINTQTTDTSLTNQGETMKASPAQAKRLLKPAQDEHDDELDFLLGLSNSSTQP